VKVMAFIALCLSYFMIIMDATIVNVVLPSIATTLHSNMAGLQWVLVGYTLMFASGLLFAGYLGDYFGAKPLFLLGVCLFVLTSLGCGLAHQVVWLIGFRIVEGASGALLVPTALSLLQYTFASPTQRAKAIGMWAAVGGIAAAVGPLAGAVLTHFVSWRAVFFINIPIGLVCLVLARRSIAATSRKQGQIFDWFGQGFCFMALLLLSLCLIEAGQLGWGDPWIIAGLVLCAGCVLGFVYVESRVIHPMLPLSLFKKRPFSLSISIGVVMNIGFYGVLFLLPLYFEQVRHYNVLMAGLALMPMVLLIAVGSFFGGKAIAAFGPMPPFVFGWLAGLVGFAGLWCVHAGGPDYLYLIVPLLLMGMGLAIVMPATTVLIMRCVSDQQAGIASGAFNTSRQIGSLIGVSVFGSLVAMSSSLVTGLHVAVAMIVILFLLVLGVAVWLKK